MYTSVCTPESAPPVGHGEMCFLRVLVYALQEREVSLHLTFPQNFGFRLGRDKCHGPACFHLSSVDGCEENCERKPRSLARRACVGLRVRACCMHMVVIAFRV